MINSYKLRRSTIAVLLCVSLLACRLPALRPTLTVTLTAPPPTPGKTAAPASPSPLPSATQPHSTDTPPSTSTQLPTTATPLPTNTPTQASIKDHDRYNRIFRYVWRTVDRRYVYPSYNGVDWSAVRAEYEPLVASAPDDEHFWQLMQEMIGRLQDEHSAFLTPEEVEEEDQSMTGDLDYVGIGVYVTLPEDADYGVVLFPMPGGPAETAGVRAHDSLLEIDGLPVCCDDEGYDNLDAMLGPEGSAVVLLLQHPGEAERRVTVERARIQTQLPVLSRTMTSTVHTEKQAGYILVPTLWDETIAERTREVLESLLDSSTISGLVIDMRINGGGAYTELYDLLSLFTQGEVGAFYRRERIVDILDILPDPVANSQEIPMIVLVGNETESYAEVFAGVLQAQGRAVLIGESTAGNVETVYPYDLEDGSRLWLAEETFAVPGGSSWEDKGVQPDITVLGRWEDITEDADPALESAVALLLKDE